MHHHEFTQFLKHFDLLDPAQIEEARARISDARRRKEALAQFEGSGARECPHCGCGKRQKWGKTPTNVQRYRCGNCRRTFTGRTGTRIARIHRPGLFFDVLRDMLGTRPPSSVRVLARRLGLNKHTVWRWRLIALSALSGISDKAFSGIVEADETYQKESRKGSREWVRHQRDPLTNPKPPRMRWYEYGKKGVPMLRGLSKWQLPILTVANRSGARCFERIPNRNHSTINRTLSPMLATDAVLCSDAHPAYRALSKAQGIEHFIVRSKPGQKTMSASYHIQNVNSLHSRFKDFLRPFRGPASKNLSCYIQWFLARIGDFSSAEAFQRLLL